ncbi:DNA adenine methylase, partial [Oenococcus oeni]|uniref:DNA adenine methylase n=2 Tax=Oenococcus oeni TaxID=1247 RepID=UPI000B1F4C7D
KMTTKEIQKKYNVSRQSLYSWTRTGELLIEKDWRGYWIWNKKGEENLKRVIEKHMIKRKERSMNKPMFSIHNRRYLGSKEKLLPFINEIVSKHTRKIMTVADIFSGTGVVANMFAQKGMRVIVNDILDSNEPIYDTFFGSGDFSKEKIDLIIEKFNNFNGIEANYLTEAYGNRYFSFSNASKIGSARQWLFDNRTNLSRREYSILLTSIIYASDKVANTVGHYDAYRKVLDNIKPIEFKYPNLRLRTNAKIFHEDANNLVQHIEADLVYIDTPYNSRQYVDNYHVLENISDWQKPVLYGKARKSRNLQDRKSQYNFVSAPVAFDDLIRNIRAKYILVSYNNMAQKGDGRSNAKISEREIIESLSKRGDVRKFSSSFNPFTVGKTNIKDHKELLYLVKVSKND